MPRIRVSSVVLAVTIAAGVILFQNALPCGAATPRDEVRPPLELVGAEPVPQDLRLAGDAVTKEVIDGLAGRHWGNITLIGPRVDAEVIEALRHAASIHSLELYDGRFSGQLPRLKNVNGLVELKLSNPLYGNDLEAIGELTELESLTLPQELTINTAGARELARLTKLKTLNLYNVNLDDSGLLELAPLVKLEQLDLTHTRVTDAGLNVLANFPKLKELNLDKHFHLKQQFTNECLPLIAQLPELENLWLSGAITNEELPQLANLKKLKKLTLYGTNTTGDGLAALADSNIESLTLSANHLGFGQADLERLKKLKQWKKLKSICVIGKFMTEEYMLECQKALPDILWSWFG